MANRNFLTNEAGKLYAQPKLSKRLRAAAQPMFRWREYTNKDAQYGKRQGSILLFDVDFDADDDPSGGAIVAQNERIPVMSYKTRQGQCEAELSARAINFNEELETFSEYDVRDPIESRLSDHMAKALNFRSYGKFNAGKVVYTPTGEENDPTATWAVAGSAGAACTRDLQVWDLKEVYDAMLDGNYDGNTSSPVPFWDGNNYMGMFSVKACRAIRDDPEWEKAQYYGDPEKLYNAEQGRINGIRAGLDNHISSTMNGFGGECTIFGKDAVMEIVATPEEIRIGIPDDFGRDMGMAYYYLGGYQIIHSYNATTWPENRIVRVRGTAN